MVFTGSEHILSVGLQTIMTVSNFVVVDFQVVSPHVVDRVAALVGKVVALVETLMKRVKKTCTVRL